MRMNTRKGEDLREIERRTDEGNKLIYLEEHMSAGECPSQALGTSICRNGGNPIIVHVINANSTCHSSK